MQLPALLVLLAGLAAAACATTSAVPRPYPGMPRASTPPPSADAGRVPEQPTTETGETSAGEVAAPRTASDTAVEAAVELLGIPYRTGGADPEGFDCSGFVQYVFGKAGIALPRSVREQWRAGTPVETNDIRRGDLLFFSMDGREATHVGIALGGGAFVHAPSSRGVVRVERSASDYWAKRFVGARRM